QQGRDRGPPALRRGAEHGVARGDQVAAARIGRSAHHRGRRRRHQGAAVPQPRTQQSRCARASARDARRSRGTCEAAQADTAEQGGRTAPSRGESPPRGGQAPTREDRAGLTRHGSCSNRGVSRIGKSSTSIVPPPLAEGGHTSTHRLARTCIVVNRNASRGDADLAPALDALTNAFGRAMIVEVEAAARLTERLDAACASGVERIVVAGGDGTIGSTLDVLLRAAVPVGLLPPGTANDFARTLGIPSDLAAAADVIVEGRTRRVDVGVVNGRHFLNAAGIGFSTDLHRELPAWAKRTLGPLAYPLGVVRRWRRHRPFSVRILGGNAPLARRVIQVTVANGRHYGGGMLAEQSSEIDDGLLDLVVVLPSPWWRHVASLIRLKRGVYPVRAPILSERGARFEIRTQRPLPIATDGEPSTSTPATFEVLPRA